jgi:hypothetical protein
MSKMLASGTDWVHEIMKNQFRITVSAYFVELVVVSILIAIFNICFFRGYFDPYFVTEYRTASPISTVLGFINGINPFKEEYVEMYGNGYSVLWPTMNYLIAKLLGLTDYEQIQSLMRTVNAIIVIGTAALAFYIGLRNKLDTLLALTIGFTYLLLNSTYISMGEFSYSAGMLCVFFALVIVSNKFNKSAFCIALALITLASLFKIYFALLGIVIVLNCAAFLRLRTVIFIVCLWICMTAGLYFGLTRAFPFYFDLIYFLHKMNQTWYPRHIVYQLLWFFYHFGFIFIVAVPQLAQYRYLAPEEKRRQRFYGVGSAIVCVYVILVMLPHVANFGTYLLHIVAPMVLAYALSRGAEFAPGKFRLTAQIAALVMCITVFIDPRFLSSPLQHWKLYGVLWRDDLVSNKRIFKEADELIEANAEKQIYVGPMLASLAIKRHLLYIDNGFREFIAGYLNARRTGNFKASPLISWLAAPIVEGPEPESPAEMMTRADLVICMLDCPDELTHQFVRELGKLTSASNGAIAVKLYRRATINE